MLRSGGVKGLGADHCAAALLVGPSRPKAVTLTRTVHSARRRGAIAWCGRAGWRPHHVQNPASGNQTAASSMEQGPTDRSETSTPAKAGLGHPARLELVDNLRDLALFSLGPWMGGIASHARLRVPVPEQAQWVAPSFDTAIRPGPSGTGYL